MSAITIVCLDRSVRGLTTLVQGSEGQGKLGVEGQTAHRHLGEAKLTLVCLHGRA